MRHVAVFCRNPLCPTAVRSRGAKQARVFEITVSDGAEVAVRLPCQKCRQLQTFRI